MKESRVRRSSASGTMSSLAGLHTQLAAVMESLVHAAVAELQKLVQESSSFRTRTSASKAEEEQPLPAREQQQNRDQMVRRTGDADIKCVELL